MAPVFTSVTLIKSSVGTTAWCCYGIKFKSLKILQGQCWRKKKTHFNLTSWVFLEPVLECGCVQTWLNICKFGVCWTLRTRFQTCGAVCGRNKICQWKVEKQFLTLPLKSCSQLSQAIDSATTYTGTFRKGTCALSDSCGGRRVPSMDAEIGQLGLLAGFSKYKWALCKQFQKFVY